MTKKTLVNIKKTNNKHTKKRVNKRKLPIKKTKKVLNMNGGFFGGTKKQIEKIMIANVCVSTQNGQSLHNKDAIASVNIKNLCMNSDTSPPISVIPSFNGSGLFSSIVSIATMPFKIGINVIGNITGFTTSNSNIKQTPHPIQ
jgi:hypothetical protein